MGLLKSIVTGLLLGTLIQAIVPDITFMRFAALALLIFGYSVYTLYMYKNELLNLLNETEAKSLALNKTDESPRRTENGQ